MRSSIYMAPLVSFALALSLATPAAAQAPALQPTNLGPMRAVDFKGHVLTEVPDDLSKGVAPRILYCPSEADDPTLRAAIAAAAGGAVVDYFDTRVSNPTAAQLATYDGVYCWANFAFFDNVGLGDLLATYNDGGGAVVLGSFCTYTSGNSLSGAIMTPAYSPVVSPTGTNHFSASPYAGDGATCIYTNVNTLDIIYRDVLTTQGTGIIDGTYVDGEICHAYRPTTGGTAGSVTYSNGSGASALAGTGDWANAVANAILCTPTPPTPGCTTRFGTLGINPFGYVCVNVPTAGQIWTASVDTAPTQGIVTTKTMLVLGGGASSGGLYLGQELLVSPPYQIHFALGAHNIPIPAAMMGQSLKTQAARVERDAAGNNVTVLLNAQDLVVG